MKYYAFIEAVARRAGMPADQAEALTHACLETLAERITGGEARDLASELPKELGQHLRKSGDWAESFNLEEFVRRVGARAGMDATAVKNASPAVVATLHDAVTTGEFKDVVSQLPKDFWELIEPSVAPAGVLPRRR